MEIYSYHVKTKEFLSSKEALLDPLEGTPLLPGYATFEKPIKTKKGFAIIFDTQKNKWEYIEDNKGKKVFNKETKEESIVSTLGEIISSFTLKEPKEFDKWNEEKNSWLGHDDHIKVEKEKERKLKEEMEKNKWMYDRVENYGPLGDQLDMIFWDKANGTDKWFEHIKAIKNKFPK